jgi:hypothetical protein
MLECNEVVPIINLTNINKDTSTGQEHFTITLYNKLRLKPMSKLQLLIQDFFLNP